MRPTFALLIALALAPSASAQILSQTLPVGYDTVQGAAGSAFPFNSAASHIWQWHYANSNFTGITGPITIVDVSVRGLTPTATINAFNFPSLEVVLATALTGYQVGQHDPTFAANLCSDATVLRSGPWTSGPVLPSGGPTSTWMSFVAGGASTPFVFDPRSGRDLIIQLKTCGVGTVWGQSIDGRSASGPGSVGGNRYGDTVSCNASVATFNNNEYVPIVKIDYILGGTVTQPCVGFYELNGSDASMTVNGLNAPNSLQAIAITLSGGASGQLALTSTQTNVPWDIVYTTPVVAVPRGGGGIVTPGGQVLNINLLDPSFSSLFGLGFSAPPFANFNIPISFPGNFEIAGQFFIINPTQADGFSLAHAHNITFLP